MGLAREIVSLLMSRRRLVNTINFEHEKYVGDPLNTIRIFSQFMVDELILYDIDKDTLSEKDFAYIQKLCKYAQMPFTYGGGVRTVTDAERLIRIGCDKVSVNSLFREDISEVRKIIDAIGRQSVSISINYMLTNDGTITCDNNKNLLENSLQHELSRAEELGVGEVVVNCVSTDGLLINAEPKDILSNENVYSFSLVFLGGNKFRSSGMEKVNGQKLLYATGTDHFLHGPHRAVLIQK